MALPAGRLRHAERGIRELRNNVDTLVIIPNDKLLHIIPKGTSIVEAFRTADDVLRQGIQGITDLIVTPSLINLDFADVKTVMKNKGIAHMGTGKGRGEGRTIEAVKQAISSPLLETSIEGATALILNIKGGLDLSLEEVYESAELVRQVLDPSCNIIFGSGIDENMTDEVEITVIATGFNDNADRDKLRARMDVNSSMFGNDSTSQPNLAKSNEEEEYEQTEIEEEEPVRTNFSSRVAIDEVDVPPFIKKMRNKKF